MGRNDGQDLVEDLEAFSARRQADRDAAREAQGGVESADSSAVMAARVGAGVVGADRVVSDLLRQGHSMALRCLDEAQVYGGDLWTLYSDVCLGDLERLAEVAGVLLEVPPEELGLGLAEAQRRRPERLRAALEDAQRARGETVPAAELGALGSTEDGAGPDSGFRAWVLEARDWAHLRDQDFHDRSAAVAKALQVLRTGVHKVEVALPEAGTLEQVFEQMNGQGPTGAYPEGYRGRSLSVGDIVWDGYGTGYLCAPAGWCPIPGVRLPPGAKELLFDDHGHGRATPVVLMEDEVERAPLPGQGQSFDPAHLLDQGIPWDVLTSLSLRRIVEEAQDLGRSDRPAPPLPPCVLFESVEPADLVRVQRMTIVRSGRDALARRTLRPADPEMLVVLNGVVDAPRLREVVALVIGGTAEMRRVARAANPEVMPPLPVVQVAVPSGTAQEAAEKRELLRVLERVPEGFLRVEVAHCRGRDWMDELRRKLGGRVSVKETGVCL